MNHETLLSFIAHRPLEIHVSEARTRIQNLSAQLEAMENPDFTELNHRRILSSATLLDQNNERKNWDEANTFVGQQLLKGIGPTLEGMKSLNALLTQLDLGFRDRPVYGGTHEYLAVGNFPKAFHIWNQSILQLEDPILRAILSYIWVINVHPFQNGNGRTARLCADWILMGEGYLPLCFPSHVQGHVAYGHGERYPSMDECVLKCFNALSYSYDLVLNPR